MGGGGETGEQIYAGKYDFQCNWLHQLSWTSKLEWTGQKGFNDQPIKPWSVASSSEVAGEHRTFGGLSYVTVRGAGHSESRLRFLSLPLFLFLLALFPIRCRQVGRAGLILLVGWLVGWLCVRDETVGPYDKPVESLEMLTRWLRLGHM